MQVDDETWAAIRRACEAGAASLTSIAAGYGLTRHRIAARAKKEGWGRRPTGAGRAAAPASKRDPKPPAAAAAPAMTGKGGLPTRGTRRAVVGRLYRAISLKLEHMEKRMASGEARSAQDEERESRALATLIGNFEKVTEAVAELDKDTGAPRGGSRGRADAERMRREIAERLERLGGVGTVEHRSGKPRP